MGEREKRREEKGYTLRLQLRGICASETGFYLEGMGEGKQGMLLQKKKKIKCESSGID